jgi:hypothetical protein
MTPSRAVLMGKIVTFVFGFLLAGYNGTALYVWYRTGKVEILGSLEPGSFAPIYFAKVLIENGFFCLLGVLILLGALWPLLARRKQP